MLATTPLLHPSPRCIQFPWEQPLSMIFFLLESSGHFDMRDCGGLKIPSTPAPLHNKEAIFGKFFDLEIINRICRKYKVKFQHRYVQYKGAQNTG
jgi:hypothetical protein